MKCYHMAATDLKLVLEALELLKEQKRNAEITDTKALRTVIGCEDLTKRLKAQFTVMNTKHESEEII